MEKHFCLFRGGLSFRRWSRRKWAVFSTIGRVVRIGVLSLTCSILVVPVNSQQGDDSLRIAHIAMELEAEEVVVTAQHAPALKSQIMRVVQVVNRKEIERSPYTDMASLLSSLGGVDIRSRGSYGMQADVSIRGGTFDQALILLNGINITDPQTGHHSLNLPLNFDDIARVEVLHGGGARLFGPNAFSGAVNIITREPSDNSLGVSLTGGSHGYRSAGISGSYKGRRVNHYLSAGGQMSDGFTHNTDFKSGNIYYRGVAGTPDSRLDLQAAYGARGFGANSFYTPVYPDQYEAVRTLFSSVRYSYGSGGFTIKPSLYLRRNYDRFELFRYDAAPWYVGHNYHRTTVAGFAVSGSYMSTFGKSSVGIDYRDESIVSTVLGDMLDVPVRAAGYEDIYYDRGYSRRGVSLMAEQTLHRGALSLSGGMLLWISPELEGGAALFPGLDASISLSRALRWYLSVNRTLRLPTFTDLFYSGPVNMGNSELKPEEAVTGESGLKYSGASVTGELSLFIRDGYNMIDWVKSPGDELWQSMNHTAVRFMGARAMLSYGPFKISYTKLDADKASGDMVSNYLLDYLNHQVTGGFTAERGAASLTLNVTWQQRAGGYMLYEEGEFRDISSFEPEWIADGRLAVRRGRLSLSFSVTNILNSSRVTIANVPRPGREMRLGVTYNIF